MTPRPRLAMTYVVYWPDSQVMKVGRAYRSARIGSFIATGAQIVVLMRDTPAVWESAVLFAMRARFPRAYATADQSTNLLSRGRGYTECFRVTPDQIGAAVTLFKKAVAPYAIQPSPKVQARGAEPRRALPVTATPYTPVRDISADVRGRSGSGGGELTHAAGDAVRVRHGRGAGRGRRDAGAPRVGALVVAVHRGSAGAGADQPRCDVRVRADRFPRLTIPSARTRPRVGPEGGLGRLRVECGGGEGGWGGCRGDSPLDVGPRVAASAGLQVAPEQHRSDRVWSVCGCGEDPPSGHGWVDVSRRGRAGVGWGS